MADVVKNDKGEVQRVVYKDRAGYTLEIDRRSPIEGAIRVFSKGPNGNGCPADLPRDEAIKAAHDLIDMAGGER